MAILSHRHLPWYGIGWVECRWLGLVVHVALRRDRDGLGVMVRQWCRTVAVHIWVVATHTRHQGSIGRIMEILCLFAHAIHAVILEAALDAAIAWSFIAWKESVSPWHAMTQVATHHMSNGLAGRQSTLSAPSSSAVLEGPLHWTLHWQASGWNHHRPTGGLQTVQQPCRRPGRSCTRAKERHLGRLGWS
jgi:hypothetical protein